MNYEMSLKSNTGEIKVYVVQPLLAETYDNKMLEMRLKADEAKGTKRDKMESEGKEDSRPKRKSARYVIAIIFFRLVSVLNST